MHGVPGRNNYSNNGRIWKQTRKKGRAGGKAGAGWAGHQYAAVCERVQGPVVTASSGCNRVYAGSIFFIVEQLLQLVR